MSFRTFSFTAFAARDLFEGPIDRGSSFTQPEGASLTVDVVDNDRSLSGDRFDHALDRRGQTASIDDAGSEIGNGGQIYAEKAVYLHGSDGRIYYLIEIEQEHGPASFYTYAGKVPPPGVTLTVGGAFDVHGIGYAHLGAGEIAAPKQNIVEIAAGSTDFNILVMALEAAGLVETVQNATDITVFAPSDAAFTQLAVDLGFAGEATDEDAVFGFLVSALTDLGGGDPIPLLTDILLYHVSAGAKTAAQVDALDQVETLLDGATFGSEGAELIDNEPDVANPSIVTPDIAASNGTIQVLDRVLLPIDIPGNTPDVPTLTGLVAASGGTFDQDAGDFDILLNAVQAAGLAGALDDPEADLTVFAPTDAAFVGLAQTLGFTGTDEGAAFSYIVTSLTLLSGGGDPIPLLTDILLYHVAPGTLDADAVLAAETLPTLLNVDLGVDGLNLVDRDPDIADPEIIATNLAASNGIAHAIDGVLIPVDLLTGDGSRASVDFKIGDDGNEVFRTGGNTDFVAGEGGHDRIYLGRGDDVGLGGEGDDRLFGGSGNDRLDGGAGHDVLNGGRGNDALVGGEDADRFVFNGRSGADVIEDFTVGEDVIALRIHGVNDFDDLEGHISDTDAGAVIELAHTRITLEGVEARALTEADFLFH